jgi:ABC-type molybdate transport system permease subunit
VTIGNTVVVVLFSLALEIGLGLALALTLHRRFALRGLVRTLVLMPLGVPTVVSAAVMLLIFTRAGYLNALLLAVADGLGALGIHCRVEPVGWTVAGGWRTLFTVAVADTWKVVPVVTLILLAGLQAIPEEVEEAARTDGATGWRRLLHVVLPLLAPYLTAAVILRAIDAFRSTRLATPSPGSGPASDPGWAWAAGFPARGMDHDTGHSAWCPGTVSRCPRSRRSPTVLTSGPRTWSVPARLRLAGQAPGRRISGSREEDGAWRRWRLAG